MTFLNIGERPTGMGSPSSPNRRPGESNPRGRQSLECTALILLGQWPS